MSSTIISSVDSLICRIVDRLQQNSVSEQLVFAMAKTNSLTDGVHFDCVEAVWLDENDYLSSDQFHLELSDKARTALVQRADRLGASLVEFHSHTFPAAARFSSSDWRGFDEFLPYIWWRLPNRPYAAVVVGPDSVDGIAWPLRHASPVGVTALYSASRSYKCTNLSRRDAAANCEAT